MAAVTLGTETAGSILCPVLLNSVVGIKPTVGLTSRAGVVPTTPRQDTVAGKSLAEHKSKLLNYTYYLAPNKPICRTVKDAVHVLDAIVGYDALDTAATLAASKYIPHGGYTQFLKKDGLKGKRIGVPNGFFTYPNGTVQRRVYQQHLDMIRSDRDRVPRHSEPKRHTGYAEQNGQQIALPAELKLSLNAYLSDLAYSPVRSLAEVIAFNNAHPVEEKLEEFGQLIFLVAENTTGIGATEKAAISQLRKLSADGLEKLSTFHNINDGKYLCAWQEKLEEFGQLIFLVAENTTGIGATEKAAISQLRKLSADGLEKLMKEHQLDAVVTPNDALSPVLAIGGMPGITVPAGYGELEVPFGLCFGGLKGYEPRLIEMAYAFEQVTKVRKTPTFKP
ncbi:hypothetical protein ACQ4PT_022006 [Festuca glaucescens]